MKKVRYGAVDFMFSKMLSLLLFVVSFPFNYAILSVIVSFITHLDSNDR